jgi:hypothetical protein
MLKPGKKQKLGKVHNLQLGPQKLNKKMENLKLQILNQDSTVCKNDKSVKQE